LSSSCSIFKSRRPASERDSILAKIYTEVEAANALAQGNSSDCKNAYENLYTKLFNIAGTDTYIETANLNLIDEDIQASFETRIALKESFKAFSIGNSTDEACLASAQDVFKALRYVEDYLIELRMDKTSSAPSEYVSMKGEFPYFLINPKFANEFKSYEDLKSGDIIFEVAGGSKDQWLGRTALMTDDIIAYYDNRVICASFCKLIRYNKNIISPYFMKYFLSLYYSTGLVSTYQVQSTGISNYQFEAFLTSQKVLVPTEDLKNAFDKQVIPLVKQKDNLSLANIKLKNTRDMLISRLISGKLPVDGLEIHFPPSMKDEKVTVNS